MKFPTDQESERKAMEGKNGEGTTVLVGIKMDGGNRELLTWALVNVAQPGDTVIALHVVPGDVLDSDLEPSSMIPFVKALNAVIGVYEGFCNLKQIDLKLKIRRGSSVRKILAQEASLAAASNLIVGVSKCTAQGLSYSSFSVAKYCAKKLTSGCLVLAVDNGKIIYRKETTGDTSLDDISLGSNFVKPCKTNEQPEKDADPARQSFHCLPCSSKARLSCEKINGYAAKLFWRFSLLKNENSGGDDSLSEPFCSSSAEGRESESSSEYGKESVNSILMEDHGRSYGGCASMLISELTQRRPGWPLLRRAFSSHKKNSSQAKRVASIVRSALHIPLKNSIPLAVHPDFKQDNSGEVADETKVIPKELLSLQEKFPSMLFSYKELKQATSNFCPENIIGKGGNSIVYNGFLSDGKEIAVKVLEHTDDALMAFTSEIEIMSNLCHKNIMSLSGFCFEGKRFVLVYDYLTRGSLEDNLHGIKRGKNDLGWADRYKIAVGVAEALECLHESSTSQPVIHRDVKSSNILLSDEFEPKLSDFGLAQMGSTCMKSTTSDFGGTFGYLAPECFVYGEVDEKVDVYAFGVVLLELLSGRKPVCTDCPKGEESLVLWAKPMLRGWKLEQLLDPCLSENYNADEMERMSLAAYLCIRQVPANRPNIALVVKLIKGYDEAVKWARLELCSSKLFNEIDGDATPFKNSSIQSHIDLALLGIDDDDDDDDDDGSEHSSSSTAHSFGFVTSNSSVEEYLKKRWSRSSSFS